MAQKASVGQVSELVSMIARGVYDSAFVQALIEKRPDVVPPSLTDLKHYRLHVTYAILPCETDTDVFSAARKSIRHKSCASIDETPGEREFLIAEVPAQFQFESFEKIVDALAEHLDYLGYRFAIESEAVEFSRTLPEPQLKTHIYALGSTVLGLGDGHRFVSVLYMHYPGRTLLDYWSKVGIGGSSRLLLVRNVRS